MSTSQGLATSCRRTQLRLLATAEHIASDLVAYAGRLVALAQTGYVPFGIAVDGDTDPAVLLTVIQGRARCWPRSLRTTPDQVRLAPLRAGQCRGLRHDGIVETLVRTQGIATDWTGPATVTMRQILADRFASVGESGSSARW